MRPRQIRKGSTANALGRPSVSPREDAIGKKLRPPVLPAFAGTDPLDNGLGSSEGTYLLRNGLSPEHASNEIYFGCLLY